MALYRNIAGVGGHVGATLFPSTGGGFPILSPTTTTISLPYTNPITDPNYDAEKLAAQQAYQDMINSRYDWLMQHTYDEITAAGYYVLPNDGSIFQWSDPNHTTSTAWLALQDIQAIENARGTAGQLLLHMQEPAIAKDTAGFSSGSSSTFQQSGGVTNPTPDTQPIPEVATLPPVTTSSTGTTVFVDTNTPMPSTPIPITTTTVPTTPITPVTPTNTLGGNALPLGVVALTAAIALFGDQVIGRRSRLAFVGSAAILGYLTIKKQ